MKLKLAIVAVALLTATSAFAQEQPPKGAAQNPPPKGAGPGGDVPKPSVADIQKVAKSISADKAKMQTYCDIGKLNQQMAAADQKKDTKQVESLGVKADAMMQKLGPDFMNVMDGLDQVDDSSPEGKAFVATFGELDKQCK